MPHLVNSLAGILVDVVKNRSQAGLADRLGTSFPSWLDGFDSRIPLSLFSTQIFS